MALAAIGVTVPESPSEDDVAAGFDAAVEAPQRRLGQDLTDLGEIARQAGIAALYSLTQERLPCLWRTTQEDVRTTLATFTEPEKFGELAQRFFTGFVERSIHYFLDRAMPMLIGPDRLAHSVGDLAAFDAAIHRHCGEATLIMRAFAKDWLAKNVLHERKGIERKEIAAFGAYAAEKIRKELAIRSQHDKES